MSNEPVAWMHNLLEDNIIAHRPFDLDRHPDRWTPLYKSPTPCETCQALARTVMMDQTSHDTHPVDDTALLRHIARLAHCGGLIGLSESDALIQIRKASLPFFDTGESREDIITALRERLGERE